MKPMAERLFGRIVKEPSGCWIWTGATTRGYGVIGRGRRGQGTTLTHRAAYELLVGPIPIDRPHLDHLCRQPLCCNPAHLEPVTQMENNARQWAAMRKPHCPRGHEFTPENTYRIPSTGSRMCRQCVRARERATA